VSGTGRGKVEDTGRGLDFTIDGDGYFVVESGHGGYLFTRDGSIFLSADAYLVNGDGYRMAPAMQLAADAHIVKIEPDGRVSYKRKGDVAPAIVGYLKLARFANPSKLQRDGKYFLPTAGSGDPTTHRPGTGGMGLLKSGMLEK
jgi:flagellar basal body rod protein FlgG